jgi:hypothetical protein
MSVAFVASMLLVTSCDSSKYFARLMNLIGSAQYWEPDLEVVVYDLGLTPADLATVRSWRNVIAVHAVPFHELPAHVRHLRQFAWKPWVMLDALRRYYPRAILYQDAGQELRQRIDAVRELVARDGHMFVAQDGPNTQLRCCGTIRELTHAGTLAKLGADTLPDDAPMCAGGIQAYLSADAPAVAAVLEPTLRCAMDVDCIAPEGASLANHRYDQSVFSVHLYRAGIACQRDPRFWTNRGNNRQRSAPNGITDDHTKTNNAILFSRRGWGVDYDRDAPTGAARPPFVQYLRVRIETDGLKNEL